MTNPIASRVAATPHPRLTLLLLAGAASLATGGALVAAGPWLPDAAGSLAFRTLVLGYVLVLFGGAGYVALAVGERFTEFERRR